MGRELGGRSMGVEHALWEGNPGSLGKALIGSEASRLRDGAEAAR